MADENIKTTLQFQADITDFKGAMSEARAAIGLANSQFKEASSSMDDWRSSTDGLKAKLDQLASVEDAQKRQLDVLNAAYNKVVEEQGEASTEAVKLKTQINNQKAAINKTAKEHKKFADKLEELEQGASGAEDALEGVSDAAEDAGKAAKDAGNAAKDAGDGWTIFKDIVADTIKDVLSGAVDAILSAAEATREYRRDMAQMAQNAKDSSKSMADMKRVLSDVASVTGETDAAMEGLNMLMATGFDTSGIELAADALSGAATKFDGLKFEGIAEGLQESLAVGEAVGPFAELIERTGANLETFNEGMANCTTTAEKQQYVLQWLAESGLQEVHDSYVQNNADLVAAEKAQFRYNDSLAAVGAVLEPIQTGLQNLAATVLEQVAPVIQNIIQWTIDNLPTITPIITGISAALGVLATALAIQGIISGVQKAMALLNATFLANPFVLVTALIAGLVAAFIYLWNNCESFRTFFVELWAGIKEAVASAKDFIVETFESVVEWVTGLPEKIGSAISGALSTVTTWGQELYNIAKEKLSSFVSEIFTQASQVPEKISSAISDAISKVTTWGQNLYNTAKEKLSSFVSEIFTQASQVPGKISSAISSALQSVVTWGQDLVSKGKQAASDLVSAVVDGVSGLPGKMLDAGKNLVSGLWEGISSSYEWIKEKISDWVGNVTKFIKKLFGIHSPSTVMRDEVGKMLGLGMAEGIEESRNAVNSAVRGLGNAAMSGLSGSMQAAAGGSAGGGGKTIIINQTNNSPRALSRLEIYRQTRNALSYAGGV